MHLLGHGYLANQDCSNLDLMCAEIFLFTLINSTKLVTISIHVNALNSYHLSLISTAQGYKIYSYFLPGMSSNISLWYLGDHTVFQIIYVFLTHSTSKIVNIFSEIWMVIPGLYCISHSVIARIYLAQYMMEPLYNLVKYVFRYGACRRAERPRSKDRGPMFGSCQSCDTADLSILRPIMKGPPGGPGCQFCKGPNKALHCHVLGTRAAAFLFIDGSAVRLLRVRGSRDSICIRVPRGDGGPVNVLAADASKREFGGASTNVLSANRPCQCVFDLATRVAGGRHYVLCGTAWQAVKIQAPQSVSTPSDYIPQ